MKNYLFLFLLVLSVLSFGQEVQEKPYIEVTGIAEKEIVPDEIFISITLSENQSGKDDRSIVDQEKALKKGLGSIGIDLKNLSLSSANSRYTKTGWTKKDAVGSSQYLLKVTDATTTGKVFKKLDELKIQSAYISKVWHSQMVQLKKETRINAIKAAKAKADYLLEAIGETTDKPLIVRENDNNFYPQYRQANQLNYASASFDKSGFDDTELDFKKIKISASVYVKFGIK